MKTLVLSMVVLASLPAMAFSQLVQTFEAGEDTSNWGASWTGGGTTPTFLSASFGGTTAGDGVSDSQSFSRSFKNNTAGIDLSKPYTISVYVQINAFDGTAGGQFQIIDGDFGTGNAANLQVATVAPNVFEWQARDNTNGWQDLGIAMDLETPYHVVLTVNPSTFTYSATVQHTDTDGNVLQSGALTGLAFDTNVINNHQNGNLDFYVQASDGGTVAFVDNINIDAIPEPSTYALTAGGLATLLCVRKRRNFAR